MLENLKNSKKTVGLKQTLKAVESGLAEAVFIARDVDQKIITIIETISKEKNINIIYVESKKVLGKACGIDVGAAVAGLLLK